MKRKLLKYLTKLILLLIFILFVSQTDQINELINLYNQKKYYDAEVLALSLLESNPENIKIYEILSWSLYRQNKFKKAIEYSNQGLSIEQNNISLLNVKGRALIDSGSYIEGAKIFENLLTLNSQDAWNYYFYGKSQFFQNKFYSAIVAYEAALYLKDDVEYFYYYLGLSYYKVGERKKALEILEKGKSKFPYYQNINNLIIEIKG
ncbi:MAG: hypothetical protein N3A58_02475 [Spirochaetes bacterium]|nr:hypothetical protein [Spirochaetota bacterium]